MILSSNTSGLYKLFGTKMAIELNAEAGFDAVDISLHPEEWDRESAVYSGDYLSYAHYLRDTADICNIPVNQTHAIFPTSFTDEKKTEEIFGRVLRDIEISSVLGAKTVVVHPMQHLEYISGSNAKQLKSMNFEFYKKLIPYCEELGIKVATENMWQKSKISGNICDSVCSRTNEFCEYIDTINSRHFTACLDLGHCGLVGLRADEMIRGLGHDRLTAIHVHDNNGKEDSHVLPMTPFIGKMDWEAICKALADIDYTGDLTFEADNSYAKANEMTVKSILRYAHDTGRYLISRINYYRENPDAVVGE